MSLLSAVALVSYIVNIVNNGSFSIVLLSLLQKFWLFHVILYRIISGFHILHLLHNLFD